MEKRGKGEGRMVWEYLYACEKHARAQQNKVRTGRAQLWRVLSVRWRGVLVETGRTFDDRVVEMGHLAGSVSVEEETVFVSRWQRRVDRERPRADRSRCLIGQLSQVSTT